MENAFDRKPIRVLLVDDHAIFREGLRALLQESPTVDVVAEASDGRDAVRRALEAEPDVIVMDISMPTLNGIDALHALRRTGVASRVVMLTMHTAPLYVHRALAAGADGYVVKNGSVAELVEAIRLAHRGTRYLSAAIREVLEKSPPEARTGDPVEQLSERERQVLQLVSEGRSSTEIAASVHLSPKSVDTYRSRLLRKLGVANTAGLVKAAIRCGLIATD